MSIRTVLVTGGAGFIGSHVVDLLLSSGYRVRILDNLEKPTHDSPPDIPKNAEFLLGDIRNKADLVRAVDSMDAVIHLAATGGFTADIARYVEVNSLGTARLLEAARAAQVKKIVVASSVGIYGEGAYLCEEHRAFHPPMRKLARLEKGIWERCCPRCSTGAIPISTHETTSALPSSPYSISKYDEERLVLSSSIPSVALRFFLTYGPRQSLTNPYTGVLSIFSSCLLNDAPPVIHEDGLQTRDFVYVTDVARAVLIALERAEEGVFNVGTGVPTTILSVVKTLGILYRKDLAPELFGTYRLGDARHLVADASSLMSLGWHPTVTLEDGMRRYAEWALSQEAVKNYFSHALPRLKETSVIRGGREKKAHSK